MQGDGFGRLVRAKQAEYQPTSFLRPLSSWLPLPLQHLTFALVGYDLETGRGQFDTRDNHTSRKAMDFQERNSIHLRDQEDLIPDGLLSREAVGVPVRPTQHWK
jgi:hypothetical protein